LVIFADHSRDDGFSAYGSQSGHITDRLRLDVRGPVKTGLMWPVPVVVDQVLAEHQGQVAFAEDQEPVQELTAEGSDDAFADGVHPRSLRQVVMIRSPSDLNTSPNAAGEERIAIMDQEP
jgi:hypothetical protein